jgi:ferredoxin
MSEPASETWQVEVGPACVGSGMCAGTAPEYFRLHGARSRPERSRVAPDAKLIAVAESCPVEAVRILAADGSLLAPVDL